MMFPFQKVNRSHLVCNLSKNFRQISNERQMIDLIRNEKREGENENGEDEEKRDYLRKETIILVHRTARVTNVKYIIE